MFQRLGRNRQIAAAALLVAGCGDPASPDRVPPVAIADLVQVAVTDSSVTLALTSPGGDAARYDLRWSGADLTDANWRSATRVSGLPSPGAAGSRDTCIVSGLERIAPHVFGLRVVDAAGNESALSNLVAAETAPGNPADLIQLLARAYQRRDYDRFEPLLSVAPGAQYLFLLNEPTPDGETQWDRAEELRIHRRMFEPENIPPGDPPLDTDLWLSAIDITLTPRDAFAEVDSSFYYPRNPNGLDRDRWIAREAIYRTYVLFDALGSLDYLVNGVASFIVLEDITKRTGDPGKFLIYRWEDLGSGWKQSTQPASWSSIKDLYR